MSRAESSEREIVDIEYVFLRTIFEEKRIIRLYMRRTYNQFWDWERDIIIP